MSALLLHITGLLSGILVLYTSAQLSKEIRPGCGLLWEENNLTRTCYQFHLQSFLSWRAARTSCQAHGGDLLSITDLEEQSYISKKLENVDIILWIGLNQLDRLFGWQWSDGAALAFVNWRTDLSPFYRERRHCGTYYAGGEHKWQSSACESKLPYICKKYLTPRHLELYENWKYYPTLCDPSWESYNQRCAKLLSEEFSWSGASAACRRDGGELWSVSSLADQEFLIHLLHFEDVSEAWIGMSLKHNDPAMFRWSDGSAVTFTSWQRHEPNMSRADSDLCVSVQRADGNWKVKPCSEKLFSVCMKAGLSETMNVSDNETCAENWVRHGEYCYGVDLQNQTFVQVASSSSCPLATITNRFEQSLITSLISSKIIPGDSYFWIGLQDIMKTGEYRWIIEEPDVSYTNWDNQEPSHNGGCVALSSGRNIGRWEVKDCNRFLAMSLCKKPLKDYKGIELHPLDGNMNQECPAPWESKPYLHHCYKVFHHEKLMRKRTWQEAEDLCQDFGADLVSLSNFKEKLFVEELLSTMFSGDKTRKFWIGFNKRNPSKDSWEWSDGSPVVSSFWNNSYPKDASRSCAAYRADMQLVALSCSAQEEWICKIPKGREPKTPDWHLKQIPWVFYQGHNYYFSPIAINFDVTRFMCDMMGSTVTSILSEAEHSFIHGKVKQMAKENQRLWIGLKKEYKESLRWGDGSSVIYTNWKRNLQSNINNSAATRDGNCVYIESDTGLWDYASCQSKYPTICKTNVMFKIEKPSTPVDEDQENGICPQDWLHYGNKCFLVHPDVAMSWYGASTYCGEHDGHLATIANEIEQAFIVMQLFGERRGFWIGLTQKDYDLWENGTARTYNNWTPTQHLHNDENDEDHLCTMISTYQHQIGKWYLERCSSVQQGFICEKGQDLSNLAVNSSDMHPVADTMEYGHKTYRIISGTMSWYDASMACQEYGDNLASITDQHHQAFVTILVHRLGYPHWIGSYNAYSREDFRWIDGTLSLFTSWADEESPSDGSCVYIDTNGYWRAEDCHTELQGALCLPSVGTRNRHHPGCPEGWIQFKGFCYSFYTSIYLKNFYEAESICKEQGGEILTILDEEEEAFIHDEVKTFSSAQSIWLNRITALSKGEVSWSDGSIVNYSKWDEETMDVNGLAGDYCLGMWMDDGTWRIAQCYERRGFLCKKEGDIAPSSDTHFYAEANHYVIPCAVVSAVVIAILLIFSWYLLKRKRFLSRPDIQTLQCTQPSTQPDDVELCILIRDSKNSEER